MSVYPTFKNKKGQTLIYYSCPKNGNTSAKLFFAKHLKIETDFYFTEDILPRYKRKEAGDLIKKNYQGKNNLINIFPNYQKFAKVNSDERCCIIRDPFKRFISAYRNRILFHKDKNFFNFNIDMILDRLINNDFQNRHFLPQTFFLGNNLNYFSIVSDLENIKFFENKINNFFENKILFPKLQTKGSEIEINLSQKQKKQIEKIYEDDFNLLNTKKL